MKRGGGVKALPKVKPDLVNEQEFHTSRFIQVEKDGRQPDYFVSKHSLSFIPLLSLTISTQLPQLQNLAHTL